MDVKGKLWEDVKCIDVVQIMYHWRTPVNMGFIEGGGFLE
jgi:hypothetical protein